MKKNNKPKKYRTLRKASSDIGFSINIPPRYKIKEIYVYANKILELRFASVTVRKSKYNKKNISGRGISGVVSGSYPNDCSKGEFERPGIKGIEYWNGSSNKPKAYLSIFDDIKHKYSYSVFAPRGIKLKSMSKWQKNF